MAEEIHPQEVENSRKAERISRRWGNRLDDFTLPCPLCRGEMEFQGVYADRLYEFAEGEPGVVAALDVLPISFICNRCGYTAEFDAELFNPAFLAEQQGAPAERVAQLSVRDYQVVVPLTGAEKSETLLALAAAIAGEHQGEVIVVNVATSDNAQLEEKVRDFKPELGDPAPVKIVRQAGDNVGEAIAWAADKLTAELVLIGWRGWTRNEEAVMGTVLDPVLKQSRCDVALVHDRGLNRINRILLPTSGGPQARAAAPLAVDLARAFEAQLHVIHVASPDQRNAETIGLEHIHNTLSGLELAGITRVERRVMFNTDPVQAIVEETVSHDLVLMGASPHHWRRVVNRDSLVAKIVRNACATCIVVRGHRNNAGSWLQNLFLMKT